MTAGPGAPSCAAGDRPVVKTLMGPTAAGKTDLALRLADRGGVALVSIDSAMIYRRLDIGTAKPDAATLARHPHALVDILDPWESYSAARCVADADAAVRQAWAAGRTPLLVGGTMLYFRAFARGLDALPPADPTVRADIAAEAEARGWPALHRALAEQDPAAAAGIHPHNGRRIGRALEVLRITGRPMSAQLTKTARPATARLGCRLVQTALLPDRQALHARIAQRAEAMLRRGFVEEVRALREDPAIRAEAPALRAVGYRQVWRFLDGDFDQAELLARLQAATRQVAKRQLSWLRHWDGLAATAPDADALLARMWGA